MTEVYVLKIDDMDRLRAEWEALTCLTSSEKRDRLKGIRLFSDAARVLVADLMLRKLIKERGGIRNDEISFGVARYGKPFLNGEIGRMIRFNVSHSGVWVAVSIGSCENGVDIQEQRAVRGQTDLDKFFADWVLREARQKCMGTGLLGEPDGSLFCRSYDLGCGIRAAVCAVEDGFSDLSVIKLIDLIDICCN